MYAIYLHSKILFPTYEDAYMAWKEQESIERIIAKRINDVKP